MLAGLHSVSGWSILALNMGSKLLQLLPTIRVRTALAVARKLRSLYQLEPMCVRIVDL